MCDDENLLLCQVKVPFGWKDIVYRGWSARIAMDASRVSFVMVTLATIKEGSRAASLGPSRNSRVGE
jgi:hypothetical protein